MLPSTLKTQIVTRRILFSVDSHPLLPYEVSFSDKQAFTCLAQRRSSVDRLLRMGYYITQMALT